MDWRLFLGFLGITAGACGGRTGLLVPIDEVETVPPGVDASTPAPNPTLLDSGLPPIDVGPPSTPLPMPTACADAGATLIYVVTAQERLYSFDPTHFVFHLIGNVACPVTGECTHPFSMAVDETGIAYVGYCDGQLFRVSTATGECRATSFVPPANFTDGFGMGFARDDADGGETLYVVSGESFLPPNLATIHTSDFSLTEVAPLDPGLAGAELTGDGAGDLFAFFAIGNSSSSAIGQVDKTTGQVIAESALAGVDRGGDWAFAFWGGDFFTFTAVSGSPTIVTRFRPSDGSVIPVAELSDNVVGAGVSTCAPQL